LLVSDEQPRGRIAFTDWLGGDGGALGRAYASELRRHFTTRDPRPA
jgi:hypothetical protein